MKKSGCGVVPFIEEVKNLLFVVGGYGPTQSLSSMGHSINNLNIMIMRIPMNNTFSTCPQVSDTVLSYYCSER